MTQPGNLRLLNFLFSGKPITSKQASARYGITRDSVRARISEFRDLGYPIYTNVKNGRKRYRLNTAAL